MYFVMIAYEVLIEIVFGYVLISFAIIKPQWTSCEVHWSWCQPHLTCLYGNLSLISLTDCKIIQHFGLDPIVRSGKLHVRNIMHDFIIIFIFTLYYF